MCVANETCLEWRRRKVYPLLEHPSIILDKSFYVARLGRLKVGDGGSREKECSHGSHTIYFDRDAGFGGSLFKARKQKVALFLQCLVDLRVS